ncbi:MAG TPA: PilN domain-containing protein [Pseudomonadales bacterium]
MAHINLLPWREWERERRKKEFLANLVGVIVLGAVLVFAGGWMLDSSIDEQNARNSFLQSRIAELDAKIVEIAKLEQQKQDLEDRMELIQELQGNRPVIVRVFDELVRTLSSGVHYKKLSMTGQNLSVAGIAESNNRISSLMRNLDESEWFQSPNLRSIKEDPDNSDYGPQASTFDLTFVQNNPNKSDEEEGE